MADPRYLNPMQDPRVDAYNNPRTPAYMRGYDQGTNQATNDPLAARIAGGMTMGVTHGLLGDFGNKLAATMGPDDYQTNLDRARGVDDAYSHEMPVTTGLSYLTGAALPISRAANVGAWGGRMAGPTLAGHLMGMAGGAARTGTMVGSTQGIAGDVVDAAHGIHSQPYAPQGPGDIPPPPWTR